MRSLRTSPWDPYEALPRDYARIFALEDFKCMERDVKRERGGVELGTRVTVYIRSVPKSASTTSATAGAPFVFFGLLQHEYKKTDLHFLVQRNTEYEGSVPSRTPLSSVSALAASA
ncbi:ribosome biogenesis protein BMS1/TSR1 [Hygrophoropsis aurantiaca]|uniref:Ribosome biogenesis protein BMS1/TSR1 n=1 Tax=Hygrophoropsis aurantiaca TaxID=72124 RepID=A0ACB8AGZ3_9AGAM|nr:ribosome biogenesis protein BMS1/TSR1 [Hygrophoropsis aurantiaca]